MISLRRGAVATVAALAAVSLLAACGETPSDSKFGPMQNVEYAPTSGISLDSTVVQVRNLYALAAEGPIAPRLRMTLVNTTSRDDALVGATAGRPAISGRLIGGTLGAVPVKARTTVIIGSDLGAQITFPGLEVKAGTWIPITLLFRNGRAVTGSVLVSSPRSQYSDGTIPTAPVAPTQNVLPEGEDNPLAEEAQVQQGVDDTGELAPENEEH